jgi:hypothetical protein
VLGIVGGIFSDPRDTAVTRPALAGFVEAAIVSITGHTVRQVTDILDAHHSRCARRLATARSENQNAKPAALLVSDVQRRKVKSSVIPVAGEPGLEPGLTESEDDD